MQLLSTYLRHYKNILTLGIPIVIGQMGIIFVGFADNIMVGQFATEHLAASSFVNSMFNIPVFFGLGFAYGLTPLVGQMYGAKDSLRASQYLKNSLLINLCIAVLLTLLMGVALLNIEWFGQPEELLPIIRPYFLLQLASIPFVMLFNSFKQFSDGINNSRTPMYIMLASNVLNITGNYILIYGKLGLPAMGVTGAGLSTLLSRVFMLIAFAIVFCTRVEFKEYYAAFKKSVINKADSITLNKMGWMVGTQMGMETSLFSIAGVMIGWLGATNLAAHQVLVTVSTLGFMLYYGIGAAMSVRISNHYGRGDMTKVRTCAAAGTHIILAMAMVVSLIFLGIRNVLGGVFTDNSEVSKIVSGLVVMLMLYQLGDAIQIAFANALRAVGDVVSLAVVSFVGYLLVAVPVCYVCGIVFDWGIMGIWIGFPVGLTLTGVLFMWRFYKIVK